MSSAALEDINWLNKRLKGIMALSDDIKSHDELKHQIDEMNFTLSNLRAELKEMHEAAAKHTEMYENMMQAYAAKQKAAELKAEEATAKAYIDAKEIMDKAEREAFALRQSAQADKLAIDKEVQTSKLSLKAINTEVNNSVDFHNKLMQEIAQIKAKF